MRFIFIILYSFAFYPLSFSQNIAKNAYVLTDHDLSTYYWGVKGLNKLIFDMDDNKPMLVYTIHSSGRSSKHDPVAWKLKGSNDGKKWTLVDEKSDQHFFARFQENFYEIKNPGKYRKYIFEMYAADKKEILTVGDIEFSDKNPAKNWKGFNYPVIDFNDLAPNTKGSELYFTMVADPEAYLKYHTLKVAQILFFTDKDPMNKVEKITYLLKDYDGVSSKSGNPPAITIEYSTQHIEKSANESLFKLDSETRGVLYHELTHAYQFEPKGIGTYSTNKEFWACIEGMADAVRAQAGFLDYKTRRPGGHWLDGYRTTGFFIQWLTTKDADAIRKIHQTVRDLDVWSFDKAIKSVFGKDKSIESMWNEYQEFLQAKAT